MKNKKNKTKLDILKIKFLLGCLDTPTLLDLFQYLNFIICKRYRKSYKVDTAINEKTFNDLFNDLNIIYNDGELRKE